MMYPVRLFSCEGGLYAARCLKKRHGKEADCTGKMYIIGGKTYITNSLQQIIIPNSLSLEDGCYELFFCQRQGNSTEFTARRESNYVHASITNVGATLDEPPYSVVKEFLIEDMYRLSDTREREASLAANLAARIAEFTGLYVPHSFLVDLILENQWVKIAYKPNSGYANTRVLRIKTSGFTVHLLGGVLVKGDET